MKNKQYFKLEELKHKYNQKLKEAQEANDEIESTYFSGVVNAEIIENWVTEWIESDPIGYILRNY